MGMIYFIVIFIVNLGYSFNSVNCERGFFDFGITVPSLPSGCPKLCENRRYSTVMVQTAVSNLSNINTNIANYTAIVNYKCKNIPMLGDLGAMKHNLYQSLCEDRLEFCKENITGFDRQWQSIDKSKWQTLSVDLRLPSNAEELFIKISQCSEESMMLPFTVNHQEINYKADPAYKYNLNVFSTSALSKSPLILSIERYPNVKVADVIFNIAKSRCAYGWHQAADNALGYKCFVNASDSVVEGGYLSLPCRIGGREDQLPDTKNGTDTCAYYMNGEENVCRERCYNMRDCSYMCAMGTDGSLKEGGYIVDVNSSVKYPDVIGSGRWKVQELPPDMVLFNECKTGKGLCSLGDVYCQDEDNSFSCTNGTYNMRKCIANKVLSPYWRCPVDEEALSIVVRTPGLLRNAKDSIFYKKEIISKYSNTTASVGTIKLFYRIIKDFSGNKTNDSFNLPMSEKRNFASFLLNKFVDDYVACSKENAHTVFEDESFYHSSVDIAEDKEEVDIEMSPESKENNTQFIKLELKKPDRRTNERRKIRANYFQYKNMDIMDESEAIRNNFKNMNQIKDMKISPEDVSIDNETEEQVLYKNSKMFTLKVDDTSAIKSVKYKLAMIEQVRPHSWLYQIDNVCGFLDENQNWTWSTSGCQLVENGTDTYCQCNHLSNFAMLFSMREVNRVHLKVFEVMSIIGGVINVVSLLLFLVFVLFINSRDKLRIDQLNIAICLMLGTLVFLCGSLFSKNLTLCSVAALMTHFLILAAFIWMLILGINVVRLIASLRYQNEDWLVKYRLIMLAAGYSIPLVIVSISGALYWKNYGLISDNVCWIKSSSKAFLSFLIPVGLIVATNTVGLFFIANILIRNYINTHKTRMSDSNELIVFVQLLVSMGLTWLPAYFAITYLAAMYLFVIFFPLQGLLMFLLVVVINKENREKVSSFIINNYNSITSKSTSITEGQTNSRSKSSRQSKGNTESDNLLTAVDSKHHDGDGEKGEVRVVEQVPELRGTGCMVTKC